MKNKLIDFAAWTTLMMMVVAVIVLTSPVFWLGFTVYAILGAFR